ncbi:MAG: DUF4911 domain-containing protein [Fervidobacterium pennivorans]
MTIINCPDILEYDILVKMDKEDVHILNYLLEAEDNVMNIRSYEGEFLRVIAPKDMLVSSIRLLESVRDMINLEIVDIKPNKGSAD